MPYLPRSRNRVWNAMPLRYAACAAALSSTVTRTDHHEIGVHIPGRTAHHSHFAAILTGSWGRIGAPMPLRSTVPSARNAMSSRYPRADHVVGHERLAGPLFRTVAMRG